MSAFETAGEAAAPSTERDLLARAHRGDRQAQAVLYEQYIYGSSPIQGLLRRAVRDEAQREDLLQEIYLAAVRGSGEFRGDARLSTYLFRVAQLTILEAHRSATTQKRGGGVRLVGDAEWAENPADEPQATSLEFEQVELKMALSRVMERVPEAYRETLRLRLEEDLDYQEIAARLGIPLNTVSTRIFKGKAALIEQLREAGFRMPPRP